MCANSRLNKKIAEEQALRVGLEQKAKEFIKTGSKIYAKA